MNGVINFLKPPGMSSNGAVVFLRGLTGCKTGHAGTLDPGACGVLPVCVGKATKISSHLMGHEKEYIAELTLGAETDTADSYGKLIRRTDNIPQNIEDALSRFVGNIQQRTPDYSAVKQNGRKLYQLARSGEEIKPVMRDVDIYNIEYLCRTGETSHLIRVSCGKGTYIRTLCEDIAKSLGSLGYMSFLARTKSAGLNIEDSVTIDELKSMGDSMQSSVISIENFLGDLQRIDLNKEYRTVLYNGGAVKLTVSNSEEAAVYCGGELLGIGRAVDNSIRITTRLVD